MTDWILIILIIVCVHLVIITIWTSRLSREQRFIHQFDFENMNEAQLKMLATNQNIRKDLQEYAKKVLKEKYDNS